MYTRLNWSINNVNDHSIRSINRWAEWRMNFRPILVRFDQEIARSVTGNAHSPPETHFSRFFLPSLSPLTECPNILNNDKFYFKFINESFIWLFEILSMLCFIMSFFFIVRLLFNFLITHPFFLLSILIAFLGNGTLKICYLIIL